MNVHKKCECKDEEIEKLKEAGFDVDQIDFIYHQITDYLVTGNFKACDFYIKQRNPEKLEDEYIISILIATLAAKQLLSERIEFYKKAMEHFIKKYSAEEALDLLSGLD
jgi:predicted nucleic acid-binding Zn finger protein